VATSSVPMLERETRRREGRPQPMSIARSRHRAGELAMQHRDWLLSQAKNMCRDESDAEDLVQEALLRFIKKYSEAEVLPDRRTSGALLITTLTNLFNDQCRRRQVRAQGVKDPALSERTDLEPEPAPRLLSETVTIEQVSEVLQTLSPTMQETFKLHVEGKKYREIARSVGIPVGTVSKRLHDIRAKLRAFFSSGVN
jgi:RNA polymerase sigma-70 factor (ECF subfamily)